MSNDTYQPIKLKVPPKEIIDSKNVDDYNEIEKMVKGMLYKPFTPDLENGRAFAKVFCQKLIDSSPLDIKTRKGLLKDLLGTYSNNNVEPPFYCDYGSNIHLGEGAFINMNCVLLDVCEIHIGKNTILGPGVQVYTATHPIDPIVRRYTEFAKPIKIGDDCFLGGNSVICPGVTIGDGVTIGAGSVVTKDIESYCVAVGNPARVIKRLERPN